MDNGFYWPSSVINSENFITFLKTKKFHMWFRLSSNIVRSDKMCDPVTKKLYELYKNEGLLVVYYPQRILANRLKVTERTIRRLKTELLDYGYLSTKKFTWSGQHIDYYILGEIKDGKEVNYAFEQCQPGYNYLNNHWWVWGNDLFKLPSFEDFICKPEFILWFYLYTNVTRGKFKTELPNIIRKTYYEDRKLLPAYYPNRLIAKNLGLSVSTVKRLKADLINMGAIKTESFFYERHNRSVMIIGEYMKTKNGSDKEFVYLFEKLINEFLDVEIESFYTNKTAAEPMIKCVQ